MWLRRKSALAAWIAGGGACVERMRVCARRTRKFSPGLHPDDRHPDVREPHVVVPDRAARDRQGADRIHRPRQLQDRPGGDRRRRRSGGRGHERHGRADQLLRRAAGVALYDYRDRQHPAARRPERRDSLEQPVHHRSARNTTQPARSPTTRPDWSIPARSSTRNRMRSSESAASFRARS